MRKFLKIIGYVITPVLLISIVGYLYIFRAQQIDTGLIPNEFNYCGKQIYGNNKNYKEIISWLKNNKSGWVSSFITFVPNHVYHTGAFRVNVLPDVVVVSYKTDYGYPQYVKRGKHSLSIKCE